MSDRRDSADQRALERLALAEWSPAAVARVLSVTVSGNRAEVALVVNGDYEYWAYYQRDEQGWYDTVEGNGPCDDWDDRSVIEW